MDQSEKLLMGIENILSVASDLEIQDILHKEECTIKNQRRNILKKLNTPSMTEAVQQFQNLHQEPSHKLIRTS